MPSRSHLVDALIAALFIAATQAEVWLYEGGPRGTAVVTVTAMALFPAMLVLRTSRPQVMAGAAAVILVTQAMLGGRMTTTLSIAFAAMLISFSVGLLLSRTAGLWWAGALLLASWVDTVVTEGPDFGLLSDLAFTTVVAVGGPFLAGSALRDRRERTETLERLNRELEEQREQEAQRAVLDERARIAREIHDVVAHSVSLMVVQAGAARRLLDRDPVRSHEALLAVESVGREAVHELRRVMGLLRSAPVGELSPQPGIDRIPALVDRARASGLDVSLVQVGESGAVNPGVELAAYRVVQEALTNTVKHAAASRAEVVLAWSPETLSIRVTDDGRGPHVDGTSRSRGHGLVGMRERVAAYGGSFRADAAESGGFEVEARIPLAAEPEEGR